MGESVPVGEGLGLLVGPGLRVRAADGVNDVVQDDDAVTTEVVVSVLCVADMVAVGEAVRWLVELAVPLSVLVDDALCVIRHVLLGVAVRRHVTLIDAVQVPGPVTKLAVLVVVWGSVLDDVGLELALAKCCGLYV